jgi:hypothetical protein
MLTVVESTVQTRLVLLFSFWWWCGVFMGCIEVVSLERGDKVRILRMGSLVYSVGAGLRLDKDQK